jgi:hypothetical protein
VKGGLTPSPFTPPRRRTRRRWSSDLELTSETLYGLDELVDHVEHHLGGRLADVHAADDLADEVVRELFRAAAGAERGALDASAAVRFPLS